MKNFATFNTEIRLEIFREAGGKCRRCGSKLFLSIHHLIKNNPTNRKIYGDLVQSKKNGYLCCGDCHTNHNDWDKPLVKELKKEWEPFKKSKVA